MQIIKTFALKFGGQKDKKDRRALCAGKEPVGLSLAPLIQVGDSQAWLRMGAKVYIYSTWKANILIPPLYLKPFLSKVDVSQRHGPSSPHLLLTLEFKAGRDNKSLEGEHTALIFQD